MTNKQAAHDFAQITETAGTLLSPEQHQRFLHRYAFGLQRSSGTRLLEVACGAGIGLAAWAQAGREVVGLDYTAQVLLAARPHLEARVPLLCGDAQRLPFANASFDTIACFEAIYYLPDIARFLAESQRVLTQGGVLILCQSNPEWTDFVAGAHSVHYPTLLEINTLLRTAGFRRWQFYGAFPSATSGRAVWVNRARRIALGMGALALAEPLIQPLKRAAYGAMIPLPAQLTHADIANFNAEVTSLAARAPNRTHRVLYAVAKR